MTFSSPYFESIDDAVANAATLVGEDRDQSDDRQRVANFYNGRDTMSSEEAEKENVRNIVNHLFGYSSLDQLRQQICSIFSATDQVWTVKCSDPKLNAADRMSLEATITNAFNRRIKESRRLTPEIKAVSGNCVLHGRDCLAHVDNFDWCPRSSFFYVPGDTGITADTVPYAFKADKIPYYRLKAYLEKARAGGNNNWNFTALQEAIDSLEKKEGPGGVNTISLHGEEKESENNPQEEDQGWCRDSSMTLPVWYLYEVDHTKAEKPVSLKIIARYNNIDTGLPGGDQKIERERLLFSKEGHFASVRHWLNPFFIDTEIGGRPTWHSVKGIGKLNFPRDADVEEFFNEAMEGAKDAVMSRWQVVDGASREKVSRFFSERSNLVPEGLKRIEEPSNANYQHAFNIITTLGSLSKENSGGAISNQAGKDELQIQAQERQSRASSLIASRMADIYDVLDDVGHEILRRFLVAETSESNPGYCEITLFRDDLAEANITEAVRKRIATNRFGKMRYITVKTSRAAGDGSPSREMAVNDRLMGMIGGFSPESQETVKRRVVTQLTRDPDFAKEVVPFERRPDPDQIARARNENSAALERGIIEFVPELSADDVPQIHMLEHDNAIDAELAKAAQAGQMDPVQFAGVKSLMTHQMKHIQSTAADENQKQLNQQIQMKLEKQSRQAEGFAKAFQNNNQQEQPDPMELAKLQQNDRKIALGERAQQALEEERLFQRGQAEQKTALDIETKISAAAVKESQAMAPQPQPNQR